MCPWGTVRKGGLRPSFLCVPSMTDSLEVQVLYPARWRRRMKHKGVVARRGLREAWSKAATRMDKNRIRGLPGRTSGQMIAKSMAIKGRGGKSGGCAVKAVSLASGGLRRVSGRPGLSVFDGPDAGCVPSSGGSGSAGAPALWRCAAAASARVWRLEPPVVPVAHGALATAPRSPARCPTPSSSGSAWLLQRHAHPLESVEPPCTDPYARIPSTLSHPETDAPLRSCC